MPSASTILDKTLDRAYALTKARIKAEVQDVAISMYIDGGSAVSLAHGRKIVVVCASSLKWLEPKLLDVSILECHESSDTQVEQIERIVKDYGIKVTNIHMAHKIQNY
jgi:hypothetical protein